MNITQCDCCKEIWSEEKFTKIQLGKFNLYLCPDCNKEFNKKYKEFKKLNNKGKE